MTPDIIHVDVEYQVNVVFCERHKLLDSSFDVEATMQFASSCKKCKWIVRQV